MPLGEHLRRARLVDADHVAMVAGARQWTYGELDEMTDRLAGSLAKLGIAPGDRVALQLSNRPELVMAYYACFKLGAIGVPVNNRFAAAEIEYTINHSACRVCISQADLFANVEPVRSRLTSVEHFFLVDGACGSNGTRSFADLAEDNGDLADFAPIPDESIAAILYTSGTTSRPKGVTHTHKSLAAVAHGHGAQIGLRADDVICVVPPMCHILGFATQMIAGLYWRARLVIIPQFEPELVLRTIEEQEVTRIAGLPTMFQALMNHPHASRYSLRSLRTCLGGGDAVPVALQEQFRATFGVQIFEGCGMTEVIPFTLNMPDDHRLGSIGRACPGTTIRLVDDTGRDVPPGSVGEILVRSDAAMVGYWQEPEVSATSMDGGFIRTGDLGRVDQDGFYWFMGRKKEIIIRAGSNISPLEVEEVLYQHPGVRECGVVGVPDPAVGEVVWAFVALRDGRSVEASELQAFARERLAPYKIPEAIRFLDELPRGLTGKVQRRALREKAAREREEAS